jgi:RHS repeat-associated protein
LLNLPDTIKNGSTIIATYCYDATGNKLRNVNTSNGTWDYVSVVVYQNIKMDFVSTEEGRAYLNADSTYHYEYDLKDYLGNVRASYDLGTSYSLQYVQENDYYPFGLTTKYLDNANGNRYLYNGKEQQSDLTNVYDYGARFYDPLIARWTSVDPLAEKSRRFSPYDYGDDNSIRNIDPDGMEAKDNYKLSKNGDITLVAKTNDKTDKLYATDSKGNIKANKSVTLKKGILGNDSKGTVSAGGDKYNVNIYKTSDTKSANALFKFAANNSNVEWGLNEFSDGQSFVTTGHSSTSEAGAFALFYHSSFNAAGKDLIRSDHSHPDGIHTPSGEGTQGGDRPWALGLQHLFPKSNTSFDIYTPLDGQTTPYQPGANEPINLDEVKVTPGNN